MTSTLRSGFAGEPETSQDLCEPGARQRPRAAISGEVGDQDRCRLPGLAAPRLGKPPQRPLERFTSQSAGFPSPEAPPRSRRRRHTRRGGRRGKARFSLHITKRNTSARELSRKVMHFCLHLPNSCVSVVRILTYINARKEKVTAKILSAEKDRCDANLKRLFEHCGCRRSPAGDAECGATLDGAPSRRSRSAVRRKARAAPGACCDSFGAFGLGTPGAGPGMRPVICRQKFLGREPSPFAR
jgi:hypothetical protein